MLTPPTKDQTASADLTTALDSLDRIMVAAGYPKLTPAQLKVVSDIARTLLSDSTPDFVASLRGPAGTGKTTLILGLSITLDLLGFKVIVTSFTHKACSVIAEHLTVVGPHMSQKVIPITLHSLLNLKPQKAEYGEPETFTQSKAPDLVGEVDFVIVDECSMIGKDLLLHIQQCIVSQGISILYAGDPAQLRPVNENNISATFKTDIKYKLNEILRHDGAILNLATKIRKLKYLPQVGPSAGGGSEVLVYEEPELLEKAWLNSVVDSERGDSTVMLTYMNKNRRAFNSMARTALMGEDAPRFAGGDTLLSLSPVLDKNSDKVIYSNNQDIYVSPANPPKLIEDYKPIWELDFSCTAWRIITQDGFALYVLDDQAQIDQYNKYLKKLGVDIAKQQKNSKALGYQEIRAVKRRWATEYFPLKAAFADVDFKYAMTIHKSQGSTFRYVYVNPDYRKSRDQQQQLMYVAVTRASREVHHMDTRVEA